MAATLGLPTIEGYFDPELFREARAPYLVHRPTASTPQLTSKFLSWSATLWTWPDDPEAFPMGWRPFVKLVDKGVDLTTENAAVKKLESEMPVVNDCLTDPAFPRPERAPHLGPVLTASEPGLVGTWRLVSNEEHRPDGDGRSRSGRASPEVG